MSQLGKPQHKLTLPKFQSLLCVIDSCNTSKQVRFCTKAQKPQPFIVLYVFIVWARFSQTFENHYSVVKLNLWYSTSFLLSGAIALFDIKQCGTLVSEREGPCSNELIRIVVLSVLIMLNTVLTVSQLRLLVAHIDHGFIGLFSLSCSVLDETA